MHEHPNNSTFQFPLSERTNCNENFAYAVMLISVFFQFPLSERTNCNARKQVRPRRVRWSFSFLYRNERTATARVWRTCAVGHALSVSSIGTNELQPTRISPSFALSLTFSFLYRNERTATSFDSILISVTRPFQFPLSERTNCNFKSVHRHYAYTTLFQFPLSERTNCNLSLAWSIAVAVRFQFPLSERTNCNQTIAQSI